MIRWFKEWLASVEKNYGDLAHFEDAPTVRIMRQRLLDFIAEHRSVSASIENEAARADYDECFAEDLGEAKAGLEKLDDWLAKRGLVP